MSNNPAGTRKCAVCRQCAEKSAFIRFSKENGNIHYDATMKANGRGVYIHKNKQCLETALKKRVLNSAFKTAVSDEVYEELKGIINEL